MYHAAIRCMPKFSQRNRTDALDSPNFICGQIWIRNVTVVFQDH